MNAAKDYYSILGVLPDAEDIVIKAAYRALAQRYHPDRFGGTREKANAYMAELNEAYAALGDAEKRKSYDQKRAMSATAGRSQLSQMEEQAPPGADPLDRDWRVASTFYGDLAVFEKRLAQFSWKLSNTYRAYLLDTRQFENRESLAALMENHFLSTYFGDNERTLDFARRLFINRQRDAALALNNTLRVLGSGADPGRIIGKISRDFNIRHLAVDKEKIFSLLPKARPVTANTSLYMQLLSELGGTIAPGTMDTQFRNAATDKACKVEFDGRDFKFPSEYEFRSWFRREVLPVAEQLVQ